MPEGDRLLTMACYAVSPGKQTARLLWLSTEIAPVWPIWTPVLSPSLVLMICPTLTHWVTPPKLLSTTKAVIFSFTAPVAASLIGVLAKTVKMSARPPLLWKNEVISNRVQSSRVRTLG